MKRRLPLPVAVRLVLLVLVVGGQAQAAKLPSIFDIPVDLPKELVGAEEVDVRVRIWDVKDPNREYEEIASGLKTKGKNSVPFRLGLRKRFPREKFIGRTVIIETAVGTPGGPGFTAVNTSAPAVLVFEKQKTVLEKILVDRWVILGLCGQVLFMMRFLIQWIVSERRRESTIPIAFWWCSVGGASIVLVYGLVQAEPIIIFGQFGIIVYLRNLYLIYSNSNKKKPNAANGAPSDG